MSTFPASRSGQQPHTCHYCQKVTITLSHEPTDNDMSTEQGTLSSTCSQARSAAANGCKLFAYLMQSTPSAREADDYLRYTVSYYKSIGATLSIKFLYPAISRDLEIYAGSVETSTVFPSAPNLAPESSERITDWLNSCVQQHPRCATVDQEFVPPRLLCVTGAPDEVRLMAMDVTKPVPYAVLSYCWGVRDQAFSTVKSNVGKVARVLTDLPQTIQDAVHVTRRLKLEYLWVDSMCIIQDSDEDKSALISKMHLIYACAQVTIAATKALKCTEGFLAPRIDIPSFLVPVHFPLRKGRAECNGSVILIPSSPPSIEPLLTRAWTLQESLLSRRILSYGSRQLRWFCESTQDCDGGVLDLVSANSSSFQSLERFMLDYPKSRVNNRLLPKDPTSLPWLEIVEQYAQRNLREPSDKLIAISAVAQRLNALTKGHWGRYYAGIWEERFFEQLLWAMSTGEIAKRPAVYRAPTWSWAAVDGRPKWPWLECLVVARISCKLLEVELRALRVEEPFGAVMMGRARIRGRMKEAIWSASRRAMKDSRSQIEITDKAMQTFPDVVEDNAHDIAIHVLEIARRSSLADLTDALHIKDRSVTGRCAGRYIAGIVLKHRGDEVYERVGFIGMRTVKIQSVVIPLAPRAKDCKKWWTIGFVEKDIIIE